MFKNIYITALRNFWRTKTISLINVLGLSLGVALCLIISLFVINELSYDRHFEHADRIYRINTDIVFGGHEYNMIFAPAPMAEALPLEIPEIEAAVHFRSRGAYLVKREAENIKEPHVIWASKDFFKIFSVPVLEGSPETALTQPNTMAVSKKVADKFFPNQSALGQQLVLDNRYTYQISTVFEDIPENSHFYFDYLLSMEGLQEAKSTLWMSNNFPTYFLLEEGANPTMVEEKIRQVATKHLVPSLQQVMGADFSMEEFVAAGNKVEYTIQPLLDIHLKSDLLGEYKANFNITYVYMFVAIALFILLIACINFMNLSTARSSNRAKEVGVRKVLGSSRSNLIRQFLTETVLISLLSFLIALLIVTFLLPIFNDMSGRNLSMPYGSPMLYIILLAGAVLTGLLAGIYPSLFLSGFNPAKVLKGSISLGMKSGAIRSSLVVFQFAISIILIIATIAVYSQLNFIQNKQLGFNKDQVIMVEDVYALGNQIQFYKEEILQNSMIKSGTLSGFLPVSNTWRSDNPWWAEGHDPKQTENMVTIQNWAVDHDYITTLGMKIVSGRDFSTDFMSDSSGVIINETAARKFNFEGDPIGQRIASFEGNSSDDFSMENVEYRTVIGIVENFHFESLKENIGSLMIYLSNMPQGYASFRFQAQDTQPVIEALESKWKEIAPDQPFSYSFLDDRFGKMYAAENKIGSIFASFTLFAIFIACLGLFALTAYTTEQRTKEIGIRKVLGAGVGNIVFLLSKEMTRLVLIAFVFAVPLAWWGMNDWLQQYQYRIELGWELFLISGLMVMLVAWFTMGFQSIKAALSNPVDSLKSE